MRYPPHMTMELTAKCNFRCPYCYCVWHEYPALAKGELSTDGWRAVLDKCAADGVNDILFTGGEPLLWPKTRDFIEKVRALGFLVKLDTNGTKPAFLKSLAEDGLLDYVAVDIKNSKEKYAETAGVPHFDLAPVEETVEFLLSGVVPYEFRTTVVAEFHEVSDFVKIGEWIRGAERYFLQGFQDHEELVGTIPCHARTKEEMEEMTVM